MFFFFMLEMVCSLSQLRNIATDRGRDGKELTLKANGILPNRSNKPTQQTTIFFGGGGINAV